MPDDQELTALLDEWGCQVSLVSVCFLSLSGPSFAGASRLSYSSCPHVASVSENARTDQLPKPYNDRQGHYSASWFELYLKKRRRVRSLHIWGEDAAAVCNAAMGVLNQMLAKRVTGGSFIILMPTKAISTEFETWMHESQYGRTATLRVSLVSST